MDKYSNICNVQILVSLLKQFGIKNIVISPGSRHFGVVHYVENDSFFKCYSILDERSAAYFALGLSDATGEPVCITCTSSTATCNYMPAVKEAYEKAIPLIMLTGDRDYRKLYQIEDQMINQHDMYVPFVKNSIDLPIVNDRMDVWYCERKINTVLLDLEGDSIGPIHINFRHIGLDEVFPEALPKFRKIDCYKDTSLDSELCCLTKKLAKYKRILVLCGERNCQDEELSNLLDSFSEKYEAVIAYEYFSNIHCQRMLKAFMVAETMYFEEIDELMPDLVITIGGHIWSKIKFVLQECSGDFEHWMIDIDGKVKDPFRRLTQIYACAPKQFFLSACREEPKNFKIKQSYYELWKRRIEKVKLPDLMYTNFFAINELCKKIPQNATVHLSILNSVRLTNFSTIYHPVNCYANLGAEGIDGCLSTFLGQAGHDENLSLLIIGDLSCLYDLNAFVNEAKLRPNQRILLINNFAGNEFFTNFENQYNDKGQLKDFVAAGHGIKLEKILDMNMIKYLSASSKEEFYKNLPLFLTESNKPVLFEVFTDAATDTKVLKEFYSINKLLTRNIIVKKLKHKLKRAIRGNA